MKILFITDILVPYRIEWINSLLTSNEIEVYYFFESEKTRNEEWLYASKKKFESKKLEFFGSGMFVYSRQLKKICKENYGLFLIDGYSSYAKIVAILNILKRGKSVFVNIDGIVEREEKGLKAFVKQYIKTKLYHSSSKFLCGSKSAAVLLVKNGANAKNVFVHPFTSLHENDILSQVISYEEKQTYKKKLSISAGTLTIAVGRFVPLKRYDVLLRAWKMVNSTLVLIGDGDELQYYQDIIKKLSLKNVVLLNFLQKDELFEYYKAADLFVHPSSTEVWGLVINEAMACGLPVITTDKCVAGLELIKDEENGFIVPVGDETVLAEKINKILNDDALREKMSKNALETIRPYTIENMAKTHNNIFNKELFEQKEGSKR